MTFSAVVFDLWDTLVPLPTALRERASRALAAALDVPADVFIEAWSATRVERETGDLVPVAARVCRNLGLTLSDEALARALRTRARIQGEAFAAMRPDAVPTLRALREMGLRVGLISNCTSDLPVRVEQSPLAALVDAAVFSCREGVMKPDALLYRRVASLLAVPAEKCLYVGDGSDDELAGAQAVGMTPVLLDADDTPTHEWQGRRVKSLGDLLGLLQTG